MSLSTLPSELLLAIAQELPSESDINSLVRANRRFYNLLNRHLYYHDVEEKTRADNALYWAARKGRAETILRAECLGIAIPAPSLIAEAAISGEISIVKLLFERVRGRDGAVPDLDDPTALILALENGHFEMFRFFVQEGADLEACGAMEDKALHVAARQGDLAAAELLLDRGANIEAINEEGHTPLHEACQRGDAAVAQLLMARGADVTALDITESTPLNLAAGHGNIGAVKTLLERGADIDALNVYGYTPLLAAINKGHPNAAIALIEGGANLSAEYGGRAAIQDALTSGQEEVAKLLVRRGVDLAARDLNDVPPLIIVSSRNLPAMVRVMLEEGADVDVHSGDGWTALHEAVERGHAEIVRVLLENGADPWGPMIRAFAALSGNADVVEAFPHSGAGLADEAEGMWPPLVLAAREGQLEIGRLLLEYGANARAVAPDGCTAVEAAEDRGDDAFVLMLREHGLVV